MTGEVDEELFKLHEVVAEQVLVLQRGFLAS
jgi:hypothetical protein